MKKYAIFLNGSYPKFRKEYREMLQDRIIYCADGGANYAFENNINVNYLLGDLDSINEEALKYFQKTDTKIYKFDKDKDYTDFSIVLLHICGLKNISMKERFKNEEIDFYQNKDILVFGATGKRVDMSFANIKLLMKNFNMKYINEYDELMYCINSYTEILDKKDKSFSIIPYTDIKKLTLEGFIYNLYEKDIDKELSLVSNIIAENRAFVKLESGLAVVFIKLF